MCIVRGKAKAPTEFGAKLDISVVNGMVRLEQQSFEAYNESELLQKEVERYYARYGRYPERVLADKIYGIEGIFPITKRKGYDFPDRRLGARRRMPCETKKEEYEDICDQVEVERVFSLAK